MTRGHASPGFLFACLLTLVGCAAPTISPPIPTTSPEATTSVPSSTQTPPRPTHSSPAPLPFNSSTPQPLPTPIPSVTELSPTEAVLATFQALGPMCDYSFYQTVSPDEKWIAVACQDAAAGETRVWSMDGQRKWAIAFETSELRPEGIVMPVHWSPDSHYLYLATNPQADGWPLYFVDGSALLRLDLQTGQVSKILRPHADGTPSYAFAFSPDDKTLVYLDNWGWYDLTLHILDIPSGQKQSIDLDSQLAIAGRMTWSPSGEQLFLLGSTSNSDFLLALVVLNLRDGFQTTKAIPEECKTAQSVWLNETVIELRGQDEKTPACQFHLRSGQYTKP
jgi:hypothetical protein